MQNTLNHKKRSRINLSELKINSANQMPAVVNFDTTSEFDYVFIGHFNRANRIMGYSDEP